MTNKLNASSVHCSYYSVVQIMLHCICNHLGYGETKTNNLGREANKIGDGFHNYIKSVFLQHYIGKPGADLVGTHKNIGNLKDMRVESDYKSTLITPEMAKQAKELAVSLGNHIFEAYDEHEK